MNNLISKITLVVNDYDEAISFYTKTLGFTLVEDTVLSETKRWVVVRPGKRSGCDLLLAKASSDEQNSRIGDQTGGRVFLFLETDDFDNYYSSLINNGVNIVREKSIEKYGIVAVFEDLYGNRWDLIEPADLND